MHYNLGDLPESAIADGGPDAQSFVCPACGADHNAKCWSDDVDPAGLLTCRVCGHEFDTAENTED